MARTCRAPTTRRSRAERMPVRVAAEFVDLSILCDAPETRAVLTMIGGTISEALSAHDLRTLVRTLSRLKRMCETELAGRHAARRLQ